MKKSLLYYGGYIRHKSSPYQERVLRKVFLSAIFYGFMLLLTSLQVSAQTSATVSGTVTDQKNEPLPGVNVRIKGTTLGTSTDVNGK